MKKLFFLLLKIFTGLFIALGILIIAVYLKYRFELSDIQSLVEDYKPAMATTIYDKNNNVVDILSAEEREVVKLQDVSPYLRDAFLSIEDKQFYSHHGLHFKAIFRAIFTNLTRGKASQGGSSITQQLAKNAFLTSERKISRKIKEAILTYQMERTYTKDEILERYLNEIYFGSGSYGVKSAAEQYYRKDVKDLSIAEAALLAGIPNRPTKYDPTRSLENALSRQKVILKEMLTDGRISQAEYDEAVAHKFELETEENIKKVPKDTTIIYNKKSKKRYNNPELTTIVEEYLSQIYDEEKIYTAGLKIYTTIDLDHQKVAKETFNSYEFFKNKEINGAMVTLDPFTGGIVSIVGGKNFKAKNFDRALMARRQFGSSFKPFVYLDAMQNGFNPYTVVVDNYFAVGKWAPKNYSGRYTNNSTLVNSLDLSINIPAIKLLDSIGVEKFKEDLSEVKITEPVKDLTAALGSIDGTPIDLATAFALFVNGGYLVKPNIIREIRDDQDILIYSADIEKTKIFDSVDTSVITAMLKTVVSNGSAKRATVIGKDGRPIQQGGKTGTTNENRTIWYSGITPEYVTVCYIGRDDNKPMYGKITGGSVVAPMWARYYQTLINKGLYTPGKKFEFLENHIETGDLVKQNIDIYTGLLDGEKSREVVVKKGRLQVESAAKYKNGVASIFGLDAAVSGGGISIEEGLETEQIEGEETAQENNTESVSEPKQVEEVSNSNESNGLIDRLLGD